MSDLTYWDASIKGLKTSKRQTKDAEAHEVLASFGAWCPHVISFPRAGWYNDRFYTVLSSRSEREVKFQKELLAWLDDNCVGRYLDWPDLNQICFQSKSDAMKFKLVWG